MFHLLDVPFFVGVIIALWPVNYVKSLEGVGEQTYDPHNFFHTEAGRVLQYIIHSRFAAHNRRHRSPLESSLPEVVLSEQKVGPIFGRCLISYHKQRPLDM